MAKLFSSDETLQTPLQAFEARQFAGVDLLTIQDSQASLESLSALFDKDISTINIVKQLKYSTEKISLQYGDERATFDTNVKVFDIIQKSLGDGKVAMPSMEDFSSQFTRASSKEVALEGFTDFIKKIWKIIKDFVVAFYNKIILFFKRITGMQLSNDEIKAYIKKNLETIRVNNFKVAIDNSTMITTKLPLIFAGPKAEKFKVMDIEMIGLRKITTHLNYLKKINEYYNKQIAHAADNFKVMEGLLKNDLKKANDILTMLENELKSAAAINSPEIPPVSQTVGESMSLENDKSTELFQIVDMLDKSVLKTKELLQGTLGLSQINTPSEIPENVKTILDGMNSGATKDLEETYYGLQEPDALLSNFGIFLKTVTGKEEVAPESTGVTTSEEVKFITTTSMKMTASTQQSSVLSSELGVLDRYNVLEELFEKAKVLEKFSVKESTVFVEKIGDLVVKYVKDLEKIFSEGKIADRVGKIIAVCVDLAAKENDQGTKDNYADLETKAKEYLALESTLSGKFAKAGHNTLIDISRELCGKLTTLNHEVATEIYNYVYKCTKEFK